MHVGFYLDTRHLHAWSWCEVLEREVALSGTDGSLLRIAHGLAMSSPIEVSLFSTEKGQAASRTPLSQVLVHDCAEAMRKARRRHIDVFVFNNARSSDVIAGIREAEQLDQPCIAWCQNGPSHSMADRYAEVNAVRRVLCVSNVHADAYRDKRVFDKIEVAHNPVDTRWYGAPDHLERAPRTACYVGALTPDKGFHHVAAAWPRVRAALPDARLIVAGSVKLYDRGATLGPLGLGTPDYEQEHLIPHFGSSREAARRLGVTFRGLLSPKQIRALMRTASVGIVNPNRTGSLETFCVTAAEMQAAGLAVIGGNRKGLRETVRDGETGLLVDSQRELMSALRRLLEDPEWARRMGQRGQQWAAQKFDVSTAVRRWQRLLNAVYREAPPTPPPFSFKRSTLTTFLREGIRHLHRVTGRGKRSALLDRWLGALRR